MTDAVTTDEGSMEQVLIDSLVPKIVLCKNCGLEIVDENGVEPSAMGWVHKRNLWAECGINENVRYYAQPVEVESV